MTGFIGLFHNIYTREWALWPHLTTHPPKWWDVSHHFNNTIAIHEGTGARLFLWIALTASSYLGGVGLHTIARVNTPTPSAQVDCELKLTQTAPRSATGE